MCSGTFALLEVLPELEVGSQARQKMIQQCVKTVWSTKDDLTLNSLCKYIKILTDLSAIDKGEGLQHHTRAQAATGEGDGAHVIEAGEDMKIMTNNKKTLQLVRRQLFHLYEYLSEHINVLNTAQVFSLVTASTNADLRVRTFLTQVAYTFGVEREQELSSQDWVTLMKSFGHLKINNNEFLECALSRICERANTGCLSLEELALLGSDFISLKVQSIPLLHEVLLERLVPRLAEVSQTSLNKLSAVLEQVTVASTASDTLTAQVNAELNQRKTQ